MNDQTPLWLGIFLCFLFATTLVAAGAGVVAFFYIMWQNWKKHRDGDDSGDQGGGGDDSPKPEPPSGPDGDWHDHDQFHRELDLIGQSIEAEKHEEPVLQGEA